MQLVEELTGLKGKRLMLTGRFDHTREILLGVRTAPTGYTGSAAQGMATNPQGYYVLTPFILNSKAVIILNRGWIPIAMFKTRGWGKEEGEETVEVLLSGAEKGGTFSPVNNPSSGLLYWLEDKAIMQAMKMIPLNDTHSDGSSDDRSINEYDANQQLIIADVLFTDNGKYRFPFPKNIDPKEYENQITPETHAAYAFTWFSLAIAGLAMTYNKFRKIKRKF